MNDGVFEEQIDNDLLGTFEGLAKKSGQWKGALCELCDNAFDKDARKIVIELRTDGKERGFAIKDDGVGCDKLSLFVGLGHRRETRENRIGRFGWGAKTALLWIAHDLGALLAIESVTKTHVFSTSATFNQIGKERKVTVRSKPALERLAGTSIRLSNIRRPHVPAGKDEIGKLKAELGFIYSRAIEDGRSIVVEEITRRRGREVHLVDAYATPAFAQEVTDEFKVDESRRVRLRVGLVAQGQDPEKPGLHYRYGFRVIEPSSGKGCNGYSTSRVFGYVDLVGNGWRNSLSTLKDEVYDEGTLYAQIFQRIEPLLKAAQSQLMVAESAALVAEVEERMNKVVGIDRDKKAKRGRGKKKGAKEPTGSGSGHTRAENEQPGATFGGRGPGRSINIAFVDLKSDQVGEFSGNDVRLNIAVAGVSRAKNSGNADAIFAIAMFVYFMSRHSGFANFEMMQILGKVGEALGKEARIDGKLLGAVSNQAA